MSDQVVVDASAMLALLHREPGEDVVAMVLGVAVVSAVNWSEVIQKARAHGVDTDGLREDLTNLGAELVPFTIDQAQIAAGLWHARAGRPLASATSNPERGTAHPFDVPPLLVLQRRW